MRSVPVHDEIGHEVGHQRRHAEADLEAAIGDEFPRPGWMVPQHGRAGAGARAKAGPAFDHRRVAKRGAGGAGAGDDLVELCVGGGGIGPVAFGGGSDGDGPVDMRDDVEPVCIELRVLAQVAG
jgi:hypothetical protein